MKHTLTVFDRLTLLQVLPERGTITQLRVVRDLQRELALTEDELQIADVHEDNGKVLWKTDVEASLVKTVEIGPVGEQIIAAALKRLSSEGALHRDHLQIYDRFVKDDSGDQKEAPHA